MGTGRRKMKGKGNNNRRENDGSVCWVIMEFFHIASFSFSIFRYSQQEVCELWQPGFMRPVHL
jgi:hypothetical protein